MKKKSDIYMAAILNFKMARSHTSLRCASEICRPNNNN